MGYRIRYGETIKKEFISESRWGFGFVIKWIAVMIICCVITFVLTYYKEAVIDFILPGDKVVTKAAFLTFAEDLRNGNSIKDTITAFCQEIVTNAKLPD